MSPMNKHLFAKKPLGVAVAALFLCCQTPVWAQGDAGFNLEAERAKTRAFVNDVTADQVRDSDTALGLGRELSERINNRTDGQEIAPSRKSQPMRPGDLAKAELLQLPSEASSGPARLPRIVKAPAPEKKPDANQGPVFTPDFSRQQLSFGQLMGRNLIDLPHLEDIGLTPANMPKSKDKIDPAIAWGLPELVAEGMFFSPQTKQVKAQLESATARRRMAVSDLLPTLTARVAKGDAETAVEASAPKHTRNYHSSTVRISQPVFNVQNLKSLQSSVATEEAAEFKVTANTEQVALSVLQASLNLATARVTLDFADELEDQLTDVLRYLETRAGAGAASQADLERARTRVLAAKQQRLDQQAGYKSALFEVERLVGQMPKALYLPFLNQLPPLPQTQAELRRLAIEFNADLAALKREVEAQRAVVQSMYARFLPTFAVNVEQEVQDNTAGPSKRQVDSRVLGVLSWSLSLGGREVFGVQEAAAELRNREARYDEETRKIDQALEADFALLQSATQRINAADSEKRAAEAVVRAMREQLKLGRMGSLLDALDACDRLFAARNRQVQALSQQMVAQAQLLRRMGTLSRIAEKAGERVLESAAADTPAPAVQTALAPAPAAPVEVQPLVQPVADTSSNLSVGSLAGK